jgi:hypothetical protein
MLVHGILVSKDENRTHTAQGIHHLANLRNCLLDLQFNLGGRARIYARRHKDRRHLRIDFLPDLQRIHVLF